MKRTTMFLMAMAVGSLLCIRSYSQTYTVQISTNDAWWESVEN